MFCWLDANSIFKVDNTLSYNSVFDLINSEHCWAFSQPQPPDILRGSLSPRPFATSLSADTPLTISCFFTSLARFLESDKLYHSSPTVTFL